MTKRDQAIAIYQASLASREALGKEWRKTVLQKMTDELGCTWNASVSHFNHARIQNGGEVKKRDETKAKAVPKKVREKAGDTAVADKPVKAAPAETPAIETEVWAVEGKDNTTYYLGKAAAEAAAKNIRGGKVVRCPDLD